MGVSGVWKAELLRNIGKFKLGSEQLVHRSLDIQCHFAVAAHLHVQRHIPVI